MTDKQAPGWVPSLWVGAAVLFAVATVLGVMRGRFQWYQLAAFVLSAGMAVATWRVRGRGGTRDDG